MAKAVAYLKKIRGQYRTDYDGLAPVYIRYGHQSKNTLINTNVKIEPKYWSGDPDQPIKRGKEVLSNYNKNILEVKSIVNRISSDLTSRHIEPTIEAVRKEYLDSTKGGKIYDTSILRLFSEFIETSRSRVSGGTIKVYEACLFRLKKYLSKRTRQITIENLDVKFYDGFVEYLTKSDWKPNTIGKHIKTLKVFLHYWSERGVPIHKDVSKYKVIKEKTSIIYLTQEELDDLHDHDFSSTKRLERVRDIFVLGCSTGLRISDLKRLGREHIEGNAIKMMAYKNKKQIYVPLTRRSHSILFKLGFKIPQISEQKLNEYIKEACQMAGITGLVEKIEFKKGKKVIKKVEKWKQIHLHIAVSTFITHCGQKGISPKVVSEITGKTVKVILDHYYGTDKITIRNEIHSAFGEPRMLSVENSS